MFFLATADEHGMPQCSYKGGEPGFVRVVDEQTLAFPNYDGNGTYLSMGNLLRNPQLGLLFIDFTSPKRLRVNGIASIEHDDPLLAAYPEAQFVVRVQRDARAAELPALRAPAWSSSSARASSRAQTARRPCRTGSAAPGRTTCCPRATRRTNAAARSLPRARPSHALRRAGGDARGAPASSVSMSSSVL